MQTTQHIAPQPIHRTLNKYYALAGLLIAGAFIGSVAALAVVLANPTKQIVPGVAIYGVPVGGLTPQEAAERIQNAASHLLELPVSIHLEDEEWEVVPRDVGLALAVDELVAKASAVGRTGGPLRRLFDLWAARQGHFNFPLELRWNEERRTRWLNEMSAAVHRAPRNARMRVTASGEISFQPEEFGRHLQQLPLVNSLTAAAARVYDRNVTISTKPISPDVTLTDLKAFYPSPRGLYATRFTKDDPNRVQNIRLAAAILDGTILQPGETFSFNKHVGPRIEIYGYKEAPVIIGGELVPDVGGGVCQVSTTLYVAALLADLRIDERSPHSIPPLYVPLGMDAAVAYPYLDLRFTNTTESPIYIAATVDDDHVLVALFSAAPGPSYRLENRIERTVQSPTLTQFDPSLAPGAEVIEAQGRNGYEVTLWRVEVTPEGTSKPTFVSFTSYPARPTVRRVGLPRSGQ